MPSVEIDNAAHAQTDIGTNFMIRFFGSLSSRLFGASNQRSAADGPKPDAPQEPRLPRSRYQVAVGQQLAPHLPVDDVAGIVLDYLGKDSARDARQWARNMRGSLERACSNLSSYAADAQSLLAQMRPMLKEVEDGRLSRSAFMQAMRDEGDDLLDQDVFEVPAERWVAPRPSAFSGDRFAALALVSQGHFEPERQHNTGRATLLECILDFDMQHTESVRKLIADAQPPSSSAKADSKAALHGNGSPLLGAKKKLGDATLQHIGWAKGGKYVVSSDRAVSVAGLQRITDVHSRKPRKSDADGPFYYEVSKAQWDTFAAP